MIAIKNIFFLPQTLVCTVDPDPKAICIGIRDFAASVVEYKEGFKAVGYFAEGMPENITDPSDQLEYALQNPSIKLDYIQKADSLAKPIAAFLMEHVDEVETVYVNCQYGEYRSTAIAKAIEMACVSFTQAIDAVVKPLPPHQDAGYTNAILRDRAASMFTDVFLDIEEEQLLTDTIPVMDFS